ncbi:MAG: glycerophosphodiester phosphodiesterase [Gammaproteobacteria bacterium]|nr:glycerophosphodiester phosphodiesterase [Gammaproteobacteria bacterium]
MSGNQLADDPRAAASTAKKLVIAHRGASGYLPEHTLAAKAMAYAQGADYIEQDLVMTQDGELVVLHDHYLDTVTDVAKVFPGRSRDDGRYYAIDFTLEEIRQLAVVERFEVKDGVAVPVFPDRFPLGKSSFRVNTFAEEIELVQGLNRSTGRSVGIYPEIKSPAFHREQGKDISDAVLRVLKQYGYDHKEDPVFLQCFDAGELRRIHEELLPQHAMDLRLVQLLDTSDEYRAMLSEEGMQKLAAYVDGVGPSILLLIAPDSTASEVKATKLVEYAHAAGLQVHAYTFRREADQMPPFAQDYEDFLRIFVDLVKVDGVFTDFPDLTVRFLESRQ